jgi:hypothetical protein
LLFLRGEKKGLFEGRKGFVYLFTSAVIVKRSGQQEQMEIKEFTYKNAPKGNLS